MKHWLRIAGIAFGIVVLILILLPFVINVNSFRPKIESELSTALGRQVTLGNLSLSIFSGSVRADTIAIADDPAFSRSPFITAKSLKVGLEMTPLIFSRRLNITEIALQEPEIMLLKAPNGKWNFSSLGGASKQQPERQKPGETVPANLSVAKLNINDGKLSVGKANSSSAPANYDKLNITAANFSFNSQFPFALTAQLPRSGDVNISGKAGPINAGDASKTPFEAVVKINNTRLESLGVISGNGIAGTASFDGTLNSTGSQAKAVGLFTGKELKFSPKGRPGPETVTIKHAVDVDLDKQTGAINEGDIAIGKAEAHLTGTFQAQGDTEVVNLKLNAPNMPVDELEPMLPSLGVTLPSGSQLKGGTLSAELAIVGPLDRLVITGPLGLSNTRLANFDLGAKLGALAAFAGKSVSSPDTSIENASLNVRVAGEAMNADNINVTVPAIGVITGAGTVSPEGALAFKMLASLHGGMVGGLSKAAAVGSGSAGVPFAIEGTTSNPKFVPDLGGVAKGLIENELGNVVKGQLPGTVTGSKGVVKGLGGLLGKKN